MAANKFATILQRNSNNFTLILVYTVLEWILILLLLLNSFFTFLISKFANYFGLKRPCLWCSRVDHILEGRKSTVSYRDLVCDHHAAEISRLGYCLDHEKLAETQSMCVDCLVSRKSCDGKLKCEEFESERVIIRCSCCDRYCLDHEKSVKLENMCEEDCLATTKLCDGKSNEMNRRIEEKFQCDEASSCCDRCFDSKKIPPDLIIEAVDHNKNGGKSESESAIAEIHGLVNGSRVDSFIKSCFGEDDLSKIMDLRSQDRVIPVELIDSSTIQNLHVKKKEDLRVLDQEKGSFDSVSQTETNCGELESMETSVAENETGTIEVTADEDDDNDDEAATMEDSEDPQATEEKLDGFELLEDQNKFKNLMNTGESDNAASAAEAQESFTSQQSLEYQSSVNDNAAEVLNAPEAFTVQNDSGSKYIEKDNIEERRILIDLKREGKAHQLSMQSDQNEEQERFPSEKREFSTESLDGSLVSEMESVDSIQTFERLKASLKAEQKALSAVYAELEEERNASAIAANQTMAMITRLQEEKAAMQMEALQYQRMMEEQSEYDQEALQLLNELVIKREKEKEELENELKFYRKKEDSTDEIVNLEEMALDCVKHVNTIDESMEEFEEERMSILDQLKALEEKLSTLGDEQFFEEINSVQHSDDKSETRISLAEMAKTLLPHFDENENESRNGMLIESDSELDSKKVAIEEEIDDVYGRLEALEAEREFLKHCMGSIKKGEKGRDLLEEILQHLHDLKTVEVRLRNVSDDPIDFE